MDLLLFAVTCAFCLVGPVPAWTPATAPAKPVIASDPWAPHIAEASMRFGVPETWVREVMRIESGGRTHLNGQPITSRVGAMGLMQVMPATWEELRRRHDLGPDPHAPRDNILAGTAYIREMYDRFGAPGFLAAYNAGPRRFEEHLTLGRPLPEETRFYLDRVAPRLAGSVTLRALGAGSSTLSSLFFDPTAIAHSPTFGAPSGGNPAVSPQVSGNSTVAITSASRLHVASASSALFALTPEPRPSSDKEEVKPDADRKAAEKPAPKPTARSSVAVQERAPAALFVRTTPERVRQ